MTMANMSDILAYRLQRVRADEIAYSEGNTIGVELPKDNPIDHIVCRLTGTFTVSSGTPAFLSGNVYRLIKALTLRVGGDKEVMRIPGQFLPMIHRAYYRHTPFIKAATTTTGTFEANFILPINGATQEMGVAGYASPLDAGNSKVNLDVLWGAKADFTNTGTTAISGVKLETEVVQIFNPKTGVPGSRGYGGHMLHLITGDVLPITATRSSWPIELTERHIHARQFLIADTDGTHADGILNSVSVKAGEAVFQKFDANFMALENYSRYRLASRPVGEYVADFMTPGRWEQMLSLSTDQRFRLDFDVTKPGSGTAHNLYVMYDRYIAPSA